MMPPDAIRILRYRIVSPLLHPKLSFATGVIRLKLLPIINDSVTKGTLLTHVSIMTKAQKNAKKT